MKFKDKLIKMDACEEAVKWVNGKGLKTAWKTCRRGDWMAWYIGRNKDALGLSDMRLITAAKVKTANLVKHLMKDERSLNALRVAQKFADGKATRKQLAWSADEAWSADAASAAAAAWSAAAAAASAAAAAAAAAATEATLRIRAATTLVAPLTSAAAGAPRAAVVPMASG